MLVLKVFQKTVSFCSGMKMVYPKDISLCKQFLELKNLRVRPWKPLLFRHFYYTISSFFYYIFSVFSNDNVHACQNLLFPYQWMTLHLQNSEDLQKIFIFHPSLKQFTKKNFGSAMKHWHYVPFYFKCYFFIFYFPHVFRSSVLLMYFWWQISL